MRLRTSLSIHIDTHTHTHNLKSTTLKLKLFCVVLTQVLLRHCPQLRAVFFPDLRLLARV